MKDKLLFNFRTLRYLLTQRDSFLQSHPDIVSQTTVTLADVSKWEGEISFSVMMSRGIAGVFIKAGQGSAPDPKFGTYWIAAKIAGMPRGTFWFYDSRISPERQAQLWADLIEADPGELMHVADFEENYGGPYGGWQNFKIFLQEFQRLSGLLNDRIGIYTGYYYWIGKVPTGETDWFGRFDLWLASYNPPENVRIPRPWNQSNTILWQYTDHADGIFYGVSSKELDLNYYVNGGLEQYQNRFGITIQNGGTNVMDTWKVNVAGLNIRSGAGATFPIIGALLVAGDLVFGVLDAATQWVHFSQIQRLGQPVQTLDGWCAAFPASTNPYLVKVVSNPVSLPVLNVSLRADGYPPLDVEWKPIP